MIVDSTPWQKRVQNEDSDVYEASADEEGLDELLEQYQSDVVETSPSEFTEFAVRVPYKGNYINFDFVERRYLQAIYDTPANRRILMAGRQVEKSTLLGNQSLAYSCINPSFRTLYVSPSHQQTKTFSNDRVKEPIELSRVLKAFAPQSLISNILERKFANRSQITFRFAFLNADRCRGIPADNILIDEFQDIFLDNIPVIEECASHSAWKYFTYAGTPKSLDGSLEHYWSRYSTQNEWVVPCHKHGVPGDPSTWHWNILTEESIGLEGLICDKCGGSIDAKDPDAQWAALNPHPKVEKPFEGFRIPQLMVPWIEWNDILHKHSNYPRAKLYNEVLGRSFDSGTRPLTRQDIMDNCNARLSMRHYKRIARKYSGQIPIFMGIDWGTGEGAFTVVSMGGYLPFDQDKYTYFYFKRFVGLESEPKVQLEIIKNLVREFNVQHIGADYGMGHWPNDELLREFGAERVHKYQWVGNVKKKIKWDPQLGVPRFLCHRTEVMSDYFNAMKRRNVFRFPRWEEVHDPFALDFLNVISEYNERLRMNVYKHPHGMPDDSCHSAIFGFLASFYFKKRPDVILPTREIDRELKNQREDEEEELDTF